ncbi:MAG: HEAT repeat domain-containing protein [Candidatus Hydrogenedentes bacterium]|nr:HEAT repeat domain-containing protein [Candidatus Hydrogenedentota bacterium]
MMKDLDNIIEALANSAAGWVTRRDAAEALGEIAGKSIAALKAHAEESDVDVRTAVQRALGDMGAAGSASSAAPSQRSAPKRATLKELAQACEKKMRRAVKAHGDGYLVRVQNKGGRTQDVLIQLHKRTDGRELVRVSTQCGEADADTIAWAVRSNAKLMYCTFCVHTHAGKEQLMILSNFNPEHVTPPMVKDAVKEIAHYGDWLEKKLTGEDNF